MRANRLPLHRGLTRRTAKRRVSAKFLTTLA